jgi:hypothetical protein
MPDETRDAEKDARHGAESDAAIYVPLTDGWWVPTDDPAWYRMAEPCTDTCHHPVHAFNPERRRHIEEAAWLRQNARVLPPGSSDPSEAES